MTAESRWRVEHGDCRTLLRTLPDQSVDAIVTDPPYELGFMGKAWDSTGIAYQIDVWRECLRVLKHGGHLLAFGGSRTYHRLACAIEDAGFQIRDQIMWVYGSGFPKSLDVGKQEACEQWQGWGTALKPAHEPIVLARKPLDGTVAQNVLWYGTGALNIDGCRVGTSGGTSATGIDLTHRVRDAKQGFRRNTEITQLDAGRFPANLIHDGSDEVLELFPDSKSPATVTRGAGGQHGKYSPIGRQEDVPCYDDSGSAARFFYCAKASKTDRNEGLDGFEPKRDADRLKSDGVGGDNPRNRSNTEKVNHHPTVKPTSLMRYLVRLVTQPDGTVLDPFTGSGSTGKACVLEGFRFIGFEQSADYVAIAQARIKYAEQHREG